MMEKLMAAYPANDKMEWNFDNDNFSALSRSDIMISDFSAVMWDYLLVFGRPLIYADVNVNDDPYDMFWVDEKRWDLVTIERVGIKLEEDKIDKLKMIIDEAVNSEMISDAIEEVKKEAWSYPGESSRRIAEYLISVSGRPDPDRSGESR